MYIHIYKKVRLFFGYASNEDCKSYMHEPKYRSFEVSLCSIAGKCCRIFSYMTTIQLYSNGRPHWYSSHETQRRGPEQLCSSPNGCAQPCSRQGCWVQWRPNLPHSFRPRNFQPPRGPLWAIARTYDVAQRAGCHRRTSRSVHSKVDLGENRMRLCRGPSLATCPCTWTTNVVLTLWSSRQHSVCTCNLHEPSQLSTRWCRSAFCSIVMRCSQSSQMRHPTIVAHLFVNHLNLPSMARS